MRWCLSCPAENKSSGTSLRYPDYLKFCGAGGSTKMVMTFGSFKLHPCSYMQNYWQISWQKKLVVSLSLNIFEYFWRGKFLGLFSCSASARWGRVWGKTSDGNQGMISTIVYPANLIKVHQAKFNLGIISVAAAPS